MRERAGRTKPTLRTVAEKSGFAVTTVSRALAGDEKIAKSTRETVGRIAEEVGYVPDRAARRLRTGRTMVVSLLINPDHEFLGFTDELIAGLGAALRGTGYSMNVIPDIITANRVEAVEHILRNNLADGLIFSRTECFDPRVRLLMEHDFPFVTHGRTEFSTPHPYVDYDNEIFAREAVNYLAGQGRKKLGIILPDAHYTFSQHLRYGFRSGVRNHGLEYEIPDQVSMDTPISGLVSYLRERWLQPDRPDGYVCVGEDMAMITVSTIIDMGMVPGREIGVATKQASPIFDLFRPRVPSVKEDVRDAGRVMGELLLRRMAGEGPADLNFLAEPMGSFESD